MRENRQKKVLPTKPFTPRDFGEINFIRLEAEDRLKGFIGKISNLTSEEIKIRLLHSRELDMYLNALIEEVLNWKLVAEMK